MERQLYADDPKLASTLRGTGRNLRSRHRLTLGALGVLLGLATLVAGVAAQWWPLGVLGFLIMLAGGWWGSSGWAARAVATPPSQRAKPGKASSRSGFMNRIEERWERRRDGDR
jgi:hypothetical protein